jgi:SAM-dependent methyltransferase
LASWYPCGCRRRHDIWLSAVIVAHHAPAKSLRMRRGEAGRAATVWPVDLEAIKTTVDLEDRHWWFKERRHLIAQELRGLRPGRALDIGAAGGGNTRVLRDHGWTAAAVEYAHEGAVVARQRGVNALQADALALPVGGGSVDLVVAFDVLEHIEDDATVMAEIARILRPGGTFLAAVPCDMTLWSAHDVASGHFRRYTRDSLHDLVAGAGLEIEALWSWNVLLRPVVKLRRRHGEAESANDVEDSGPLVNAALSMIVRAERRLPIKTLPGVSLMLRARAPSH